MILIAVQHRIIYEEIKPGLLLGSLGVSSFFGCVLTGGRVFLKPPGGGADSALAMFLSATGLLLGGAL
jgi:hypothetical protein